MAVASKVVEGSSGTLSRIAGAAKPFLPAAGKCIGAAGIAVDVGCRGSEVLATEREFREGKVSSSERVERHVANASGLAGGVGGGWSGAAGGATVGTMVGGPIGTVVGGLVGGVGGYFLGDAAGSYLGRGIFRWGR